MATAGATKRSPGATPPLHDGRGHAPYGDIDEPAAAGADEGVDHVDQNALTDTAQGRSCACEHLHLAAGPDSQDAPVGRAGLDEQQLSAHVRLRCRPCSPVTGTAPSELMSFRTSINRVDDLQVRGRFDVDLGELLLVKDLARDDAVDRHVIDQQQLSGWNDEAIADQHPVTDLVRDRKAVRRQRSRDPIWRPPGLPVPWSAAPKQRRHVQGARIVCQRARARHSFVASPVMTRFGPANTTLDDHRQSHEEIAAGRGAAAA